MLKYLWKCAGEVRLSHNLDDLEHTCVCLELDLVGKGGVPAALDQSLSWTTLAIGVTVSGFTILFVDILLARIVQIGVVELVWDSCTGPSAGT